MDETWVKVRLNHLLLLGCRKRQKENKEKDSIDLLIKVNDK